MNVAPAARAIQASRRRRERVRARVVTKVTVSEDHALAAAQLRIATKRWGLSLGDRLCLALGLESNLPVLTADRRWKELNIGVNIVLIR